MSNSEQFKRTQIIWLSSLHSALRTAIACIIVGCTTLYGPESIKTQVAFPAFSYVVVILIIANNATLGDTIRGCWQSVYASIQTVCPALLCLSIVGPTKLTATSTSLILAISAFFIVLPKWTHIVAKRIALGQLVIIYVIGYISAEHIDPFMHPIHVAACTALGALACFFALLLPFPHLASSEVKRNSKSFAENASERLKLCVKAFCAEDGASSQGLVSQAKLFTTKSKKFILCIKSRQESMHCERFLLQFLKPYCKNPADRIQGLDTPLRGMEIALANAPSFSLMDEQLKNGVDNLERQITQNLQQLKSHIPCENSTVPESHSGNATSFLQTLQTPPSNETDLTSNFFLFCMKLLHTQSRTMSTPPKPNKKNPETENHQSNGLFQWVWAKNPFIANKNRLVPALKSSLSLGLAVLFGLYYSKPNGFWAGLPVGISLAVAREATFKVTNVKFQGTVIGNIYGVLGCFVFERIVQVRFIALLPWFIFTSFLQQSKMYGPAGAGSAAIGAVLILGRKNFGPPSEFAVDRIVETFIGLTCAVTVELFLQPTRAASLAKVQLCKTLSKFQELLSSIDLQAMSKAELMEKAKGVKLELIELEKYITEVEVEPSFWFIPFNTSAYKKILASLVKMVDVVVFMGHGLGFLEDHIRKLEMDKINGDVKLVGKITGSFMKSFQEITSIKSLMVLEKDLVKNGVNYDVEMGKVSKSPFNLNENDVGKITVSFIDHLEEACDEIEEDGEEIRSRVILSLSAIGFCMNSLMKEMVEVEKGVKELVQWENPKYPINLREISFKIHALYD